MYKDSLQICTRVSWLCHSVDKNIMVVWTLPISKCGHALGNCSSFVSGFQTRKCTVYLAHYLFTFMHKTVSNLGTTPFPAVFSLVIQQLLQNSVHQQLKNKLVLLMCFWNVSCNKQIPSLSNAIITPEFVESCPCIASSR